MAHAPRDQLDPDNARAQTFSEAGFICYKRFRVTGALGDLEEAIENQQRAVSLTSDGNVNKPGRLRDLGSCFWSLFHHTAAMSDLKKGFESDLQAVSLIPEGHPDRPMFLHNLGIAFESRFQCTENMHDLDEAIKNGQQAVLLSSDDHPDKHMYLHDLGMFFWNRFEKIGAPGDLEEAITFQRRAVSLIPDGHRLKPSFVTGLSCSLSYRFKRTEKLGDLEEAIQLQRQAMAIVPDRHPDKSQYFSNLGCHLSDQFMRTGNLSELEESIENNQQAVSLALDGYSNKPMFLDNLGLSFAVRFTHTGVLSDLDGAIKNQRQAVSLARDGHPSNPKIFNNLGTSFWQRFEETGLLSDIEEAIKNKQQAVSLTPDGHVQKPMFLGNLGNSFNSRFRLTGNLADLEKAVKIQQEAVYLSPDDDPHKPMLLSRLGGSFSLQFTHTGMLRHLEEAIKSVQQAVSLTPDDHTNKPLYLTNLGNYISTRYELSGVPSDLGEGIKNVQQAVLLISDSYIYKPQLLRSLGGSLERRFEKSGARGDIEGAISCFHRAATSNVGAPSARAIAARQWSRLAAKWDHSSAFVAFRHAIDLFSQVASIGDPIATRLSQLDQLTIIPMEAAAFALDHDQPDLALEWLEQARSVVWNQLFNLRTSAHSLSQTHPELYSEFIQVSNVLQSAATRGHIINPSGDVHRISLEEETWHHHRLADKWDSLVAKIRSLPHFQDFLLPKRLPALKAAASSGPVIIISVGPQRCDALVLKQGEDRAIHIPLKELHYEDVEKMEKSLRIYLANSRGQRSADRAGAPVSMGGSSMEIILEQIYCNIVNPILEALDLKIHRSNSQHLPRIWWCPTGPLTFLPLHAACHKIGDRIEGTFDYVVSSYIPTVNALLEARAEKQRSFNRLAGVAMTNTPGRSLLPGVTKEMMKIREVFPPDSRWTFDVLENEQATSDRVLKSMANNGWVHLACHAIQDKQVPTQSGFCLYDGTLAIMDIISKPFVNADLAFLSACETATGDQRVTDEAMHITGAMLGAGFRSVIGTMWAIPDEVAPVIAGQVYKNLLSEVEPTSERAAQALHEAVEEVRKANHDSFKSWVPFVHYGA